MKYYRVKYGFGKDDFYSVDETELPLAIRAQVNGKVFICSEGTVAGNNIMAILPDYNRLMGYNRDYQLTGEDYSQIGARTVKEHHIFLADTKRMALGEAKKPNLLGNGTD